MANLFIILALICAVRCAVIEVPEHAREKRCDECSYHVHVPLGPPPPPPPPPPPSFSAQHWTGFERGPHGDPHSVFSGARANYGSQVSGQAFAQSVASAGGGGDFGFGSRHDDSKGFGMSSSFGGQQVQKSDFGSGSSGFGARGAGVGTFGPGGGNGGRPGASAGSFAGSGAGADGRGSSGSFGSSQSNSVGFEHHQHEGQDFGQGSRVNEHLLQLQSNSNGKWQQRDHDESGYHSYNEGTGHGGSSGNDALSGALKLASQGLQTQSSQPCSTCNKGYALSNSQSKSGDAVSVSIGG